MTTASPVVSCAIIQLVVLLSVLYRLKLMEKKIMTNVHDLVRDLRIELGRINDATNDLAADVTEILTKLSDTPDPDEIAALKEEMAAVATKLEGVAAQYPVQPQP